MTIRGTMLCVGWFGGLLLPLPELTAQRLEPMFPSAPVKFVGPRPYAAASMSPDRERCGRSSSPVVRGLVGAAGGAAAGYLLFTLHEKLWSLWSDERTGEELRRGRTRFIVGVAAFGAAFEVVAGPHICRLGRAGAQQAPEAGGAVLLG